MVDFKLSLEAETMEESNVLLRHYLWENKVNSIEIRTGDLDAEQEGYKRNTTPCLLRQYQVLF